MDVHRSWNERKQHVHHYLFTLSHNQTDLAFPPYFATQKQFYVNAWDFWFISRYVIYTIFKKKHCFCRAKRTGSGWSRKPRTSKFQMAVLTLKIRWIMTSFFFYSFLQFHSGPCKSIPVASGHVSYNTSPQFSIHQTLWSCSKTPQAVQRCPLTQSCLSL